jgi:hypothetical protein
VLAYIGWRCTSFSPGAARVVAGVAAAAPLGFAGYFVARLDRSLRAYLLSVVTQGRQRVAAIGAAVCLALLISATFAPRQWLPWLLGVAAIGGFGVRLLTVSASNAHVRSEGAGARHDRTGLLVWILVVLCLTAAVLWELSPAGATGGAQGWVVPGVLVLVVAALVCLIVILRRRRARP